MCIFIVYCIIEFVQYFEIESHNASFVDRVVAYSTKPSQHLVPPLPQLREVSSATSPLPQDLVASTRAPPQDLVPRPLPRLSGPPPITPLGVDFLVTLRTKLDSDWVQLLLLVSFLI